MGDTINIPWQIANTQRDPLQTAQDSALKGLDIGQRRAGINALRGINFDDPSTVNRALNASAQAGLLDQANAVTTVGLARRQAQTTRSALDLADEGIQAEADKTPAHLKLMQDGANAVHTLLGITDPAERKAQADKYAQEFQQRHVPPQNIAEIIGDLSDDGLKAHGAFLTAAAQGQELPDHPTGYGASRTILDDPIYAQARDQLTGPFAHPIVQAALARGGLDVGPGLERAASITSPMRAATVAAQVPPPIAGTTSDIVGGRTAGVVPIAGAPAAMQSAAGATAAGEAAGHAPSSVGTFNLPGGGSIQGTWQPGPDGNYSFHPVTSAQGAPAGVGQAPSPQQAAVYQASGNQLANDKILASTAATQMVPLRKVYDLLRTTNIGPGTEETNQLRSFIVSQLPALASIIPGGIDARRVQSANYDELRKYMVQIAGAQAAQYGQGTNEKLAIAASGNPNIHMTGLAARDVVRMNIALLRAQQAKVLGYNGPPEGYADYATHYAKNVDPRAFMLDLLTKQERSKVMSTITTSADRKAFLAGKEAAESSGIFRESDIPQ